MSYSPSLLKILGTNMTAEILKVNKSSEQRLFQAIILQAFEDVLNVHGSKQESYFKEDAHDWFSKNSEEFQFVCWNAGFDPDIILDRYNSLLKNKKIIFTKLQMAWIEYRNLYKKYRAAKTPSERRNIMLKIVKVNLGKN